VQDGGYPRTESDNTYYHMTPRVGLVYEPLKDVLSLYSTYSESFDPPPGGAYRNANPLKPETGRIIEGGLKSDLLNKRLSVNMAGFYIIKDNVVTQDSFFFATQIGEQRSQGFEFSAVGKITDQWSIIANYTYLDARTLSDADPTLAGKRIRNVPHNSANLWTRYDVIQTECQTFGLAAGVVYVGNRGGDLHDTFSLPDYTRFDAGVYYNRGRLRTSIYLENLFDRQYYAGSVDNLTVFPGAPFTVRGSLGITF
jgi:iron complex outermembrane receptor protein